MKFNSFLAVWPPIEASLDLLLLPSEAGYGKIKCTEVGNQPGVTLFLELNA